MFVLKKKKLIFILLGLGLVVYTISFFYNATKKVSENPISFEKDVPVEFRDIFDGDIFKELIYVSGGSFKQRPPMAAFIYRNKYALEITKINISETFNINTDIIEQFNEIIEGESPEVTVSYSDKDCRIDYNVSPKNDISKIYLTINGDSIQAYLKNDSIGFYYSNLKSAYLQYAPKGVYEVFIKANKKFYFLEEKKPFVFLFQKRDNGLYFITLRNKVGNSPIDPELLYEMIQKR